MSLFTVGRICLKVAGRDAGRKCVVVEMYDNGFVLVDGATRRKKVNVKHLEPLNQVIELKTQASHEDVKNAFTQLSLPVWETKAKKVAPRPKKQKAKKEAPVKKEKKTPKTEEKKEEAKERATLQEKVSEEQKESLKEKKKVTVKETKL